MSYRAQRRGRVRAFLGWLHGERDHCKIAAIPTFAEENATRPHRLRETIVGEHITVINRIRATLARLGIWPIAINHREHPDHEASVDPVLRRRQDAVPQEVIGE